MHTEDSYFCSISIYAKSLVYRPAIRKERLRYAFSADQLNLIYFEYIADSPKVGSLL